MSVSLTKRIEELLVKKGLVPEEDLRKARDIAAGEGGSLGDVLVRMQMISKDDLTGVIGEGLEMPPFDISRMHLDEEILSAIPKKTSFQYRMLPISRIGKQLTVGMVDPLNIFAIDDLKVITGLDISPVLVDEEDMKDAMSKYYEASAFDEISRIVEDIESMQMEMVQEDGGAMVGEMIRSVEEAPVVKLANLVLSEAIKERASDILIEPMEDSCRVRYRIDGILHEARTAPRKFHQGLISRIKVMSNLNIAEKRLPQDGRFKLKVEDRRVDFRVSVVPAATGEKAALRILDKEQATIDIDRLGFKERDKEKIIEASEKPHGMILVCGPTGCGKTTTLYSILKRVDSPEKNLVTVEDPVEYELKGINQVTINEDIGLTFAGCLRSILRQDPDVVMVGEIRDFNTVDTAIKAALTGHLVLSTVHTNTAAGAVVRLVNMGVEPFLIASSVELLVAQRLLRKLCPECKEKFEPDKETADKFGLYDDKGKIPVLYRPKGCKWCMNTGYQGRVGIVECLRVTDTIKDLLFKNSEAFKIEEQAIKEGMTTLRQNGMENVLEGATSLEEVLRITV